jgi:hypothetical protein
LGEIVAERTKKTGQAIQRLQHEARSHSFQVVGELLQEFLNGDLKFVSTGKVKVSGDPAKILELCQKDGLAFQDLKLKGKPLDQVLSACRELIADLSYLLLKGAIVPEPVGYIPPDFKGVGAVVDLSEIKRRFPDLSHWVAVGEVLPGEEVMNPVIIAVDVVVVILDVVTIKHDRPIDLISRE